MIQLDSAPIAAIATAPGRGAIGVVRISGQQIQPLIEALCGLTVGQTLLPRHATYLPFLNDDGSVIDHGLALYFPAPHSYTGEQVLELHGHGGPVVMQMLLARCLRAGADIGLRLAQPGEFTQRAFLNNKLDLAQAEAVADLIDASTEAAAKSAARSLSGAFSDTIRALVEQLVNLRMLVEATLDFPEEQIDFLETSQARARLQQVSAALDQVFRQAAQGAIMRDGLNIVLAGQPNVGKSSLLNMLAGADVAIVTAIAGTTRDRVIETIQIDGVPINVIDTAGIRELASHGDEVERIGIQRTWDAVEHADVIIHMLDAHRGPTYADEQIGARFPPQVPVIRAWNKIDLSGHKPALSTDGGVTDIYLSVVDQLGIELLRNELLRLAGWQTTGESLFLARERHLLALQAAQQHLQLANSYTEQGDSALDLFAEELRLAQQRLNSITGEFTSDDLLGVIFSRFCIGK